MQTKPVFLLEKAIGFTTAGEVNTEAISYDDLLGINVVVSGDHHIPAITSSSYAPTQSKTMQHNGDDDHDPDDEDCY